MELRLSSAGKLGPLCRQLLPANQPAGNIMGLVNLSILVLVPVVVD